MLIYKEITAWGHKTSEIQDGDNKRPLLRDFICIYQFINMSYQFIKFNICTLKKKSFYVKLYPALFLINETPTGSLYKKHKS